MEVKEQLCPAERASDLADLLTSHLPVDDPTTDIVKAALEQRCAAAWTAELQGPERLLESAQEKLKLKRGSRAGRARWCWLLSIVALTLWLAALAREGLDYLPKVFGSGFPKFLEESRREAIAPDQNASYSPLWGDSRDNWVAGTRRAFEARPSSAAAYYVYANTCVYWDRELPADFDAVATKLDPGNGIWPLLRSRELAYKALFKRKPPDEEALKNSLRFFKEAAASPRLDTHQVERLRLWREGNHPKTVFAAIGIAPYCGLDYWYFIHPEYADDPIVRWTAERWERQPKEVQELLRNYIRIEARLALEGGTLWQTRESDLIRIADLSGWDAEAESLRDLVNRKRTAHLVDDRGLALEKLAHPIKLRSLQFGMILISAIFLGASLLMGLRLVPKPVLAAKTARCLMPMLEVIPLVKLIWQPLAVPFFAGAVVAMFAVEGAGRDYLVGIELAAVTCVFASAVMLSALAQTASKCVGEAAAIAGLRPSRGLIVLGNTATGLSLIAFLLWCASRFGMQDETAQIAAGLAGVVTLYWLFRLGAGYAGYETSLRHRLMASTLLPVLLWTSIAMSAGVFLIREGERRLIAEIWSSEWKIPEIPAQDRQALQKLAEQWQPPENSR